MNNADIFNDVNWISEVLATSNTGLWLIKIDSVRQTNEMFGNTTMLRLLGLSEHPDPQECYRHWYERIDENHLYRVTTVVNRMVETKQQYEVQYPWMHPERGQIFVRCGGKMIPSEENTLCLCGYHQDVTEMEKVKKELNDSLQQLSKSRHHTDEIERLMEHYQHLAYIDMLTGLPNRRAFFEMSQNFINSHIMENEHECWVVIADIDHFKKINDTYGHATGDKVLHLLARRFKENLRKSAEFIGRIGGEEFALFLLDSCEKNTRGLTERLWRVCSEQPYVMEDGSKIHMTCSFGIAKVNDVEGKSAEEVLKEAMKNADAALYQAKHEGRNRIVLYCVS